MVDPNDDTDSGQDESEEDETLERTLPTLKPRHKLKEGDVVLERYRISGILGRGGMGIVYRCFDQVAEIDVALKGIPPEISHDTGEMEEIRENFKLISQLFYPNIAAAKTLEWDKATGVYYLVMECAEGSNLRRRIKELTRATEGRASIGDVIDILQPVASALDFAHSRKIIHRDIKPGNIIVNTNGEIKVLDFGIASQFHASLSRLTRAADYSARGTLPYMSPEQCRGHHQDARTDQYSLAVVADELLAGRPPFENPDLGVLREAILTQAPERPEGLESRHWKVLTCALAKDRKQRFRTCSEFMASFAKGPSAPGSSRSSATRKYIVPLGAVAILCLLAAIAVQYWPKRPREQAATPYKAPPESDVSPGKKIKLPEPETTAQRLSQAENLQSQEAWSEAISAYVAVIRNDPESGESARASTLLGQIIEHLLQRDRQVTCAEVEDRSEDLAAAGQRGVTTAFLLLGNCYRDLDINRSIAWFQEAAARFEEAADWPKPVRNRKERSPKYFTVLGH